MSTTSSEARTRTRTCTRTRSCSGRRDRAPGLGQARAGDGLGSLATSAAARATRPGHRSRRPGTDHQALKWILFSSRIGLLLSLFPASIPAAETKVGGSLGFGITAFRQPGAFSWDFDSAHEDTTLALIKLGATADRLRGFVSLAARLEDSGSEIQPRFELGEASLAASWRRGLGDSLALRLFAREPQSLWVEFALVPPIAPGALGPDPLGGRVDATWHMATAAVVVARRGTLFDSEPDVDLPVWDPPGNDLLLLRLRGDALQWGGLRFGSTWKRWRPDARFAGGEPATDARAHDLLGFDVRASWRGILASAEISDSHASGLPGTPGEEAPRRSAGALTEALPATAAFRAELRSRSQRLGRWGAIGFAPQYRALGAEHVDRAGGAGRDPGSPRRGLEGYRLEAWYEFPAWPAWARHTYDRHQQFRDADRRVIAQLSEVRVQLTDAVHAEARYAQQDERLYESGERLRHDDLVAALGGTDGRARFRVQGGMLDLGGERQRAVLVLEAGAHVGSRVQILSRLTSADEAGLTRRSFFAALQYWHLPEFEIEAAYGPEWLGDAALPALDGDLTADGHDADRVRLHFRGWF